MKYFSRFFLLLTLLIFCAACGEKANDPAEVAKRFYTEFVEGDIDKAIEMIDSSNVDPDKLPEAKAQAKVLFTFMRSVFEQGGGIASIETEQPTYNADKSEAEVSLAITLNKPLDGMKTHTENLPPQEGRWQMENKRQFLKDHIVAFPKGEDALKFRRACADFPGTSVTAVFSVRSIIGYTLATAYSRGFHGQPIQ